LELFAEVTSKGAINILFDINFEKLNRGQLMLFCFINIKGFPLLSGLRLVG
jgi:hypothetical protein